MNTHLADRRAPAVLRELTERLSRLAAAALFIAAIALAALATIDDDASELLAELTVPSTSAEVLRGGESAAAGDTSIEEATVQPRTNDAREPEMESAPLAGRSRGGRSCSTLVLQNDE